METLSCIVRPSISIPYPVYPAYLSSPAWSPVGHNASSAPSSSPVASQPRSNPGRVPLSLVPTPFSGNPFDPNSHFRSPSSESASSLFDELVTPLEDLRLSEPFSHRPSYPLTPPSSAPGIYLPIASPTSAYPGLPGHYVDRFGVPSPRPGGLSHHTRRSSSQSSRKLAASYKTKPCKFWRQDGSCPNGQACSFIHDEDMPGKARSQSSDDSTEIGSPSSAHSSQLPSDLPAKPLSVIEEKKKHGFYPISWRVIGGGVMMSGKREFCHSYAAGHCDRGDDCSFAHDSESDDDASPPSEFDLEEEYYNARPQYIPQAQGMSPKHRIEGKSKGTRPSSITIPAATSFLPTLEANNSAPLTSASGTFNDKGGKRSAKSSASHRRTRSMSIPPTPGSPLGAVNLFPAESPGGL